MMRNCNNVIRKNDYEKYEIIIPFLSAAGKRRKQFLNNELEKLHPCFSDEFAFDSKIAKIKRNGFCSDVYVVNKYKLAEYERKRSLSGTGLFVEKGENKKLWQKRRLFVEKKWKLTVFTLFVFSLLALTGIFSGFYTGRSIEDDVGKKTEISVPVKDNVSEISGSDLFVEDKQFILEETFLKTVADADGKISWLEWKLNGYTESLSAFVSGVYPENLINAGGESVIYENGIPKVKVSYIKQLRPEEIGKNIDSDNTFLSNSDFNKLLRKILNEAGAKLIEEKAPPYHIEFLYKPVNASDNLFELLARIISEDRRCVTSVSIYQTESSDLRIGLSIETIPLTGFDLKLLSENLNLFIDESKRKIMPDATQNPGTEKYVSENKMQKKESLIKVGEIKHSDNTTVVFFKNSEGKLKGIISKKEDE